MFDELLAAPGVEEGVVLRSSFGFLAFHGGSLEQRTDVIAEAAAAAAGASCYVVRLPEGLRWHVPSKLVDPAHSAALAAFVGHVDVAVAVHGYGRIGRWTELLLGGSNRALAAHVGRHLGRALPAYEVVDDLEAVPVELRGLHPDNPVNRVPGGGVQLELPPRVRGSGPGWAEHLGRGVPPWCGLIDALAGAARSWERSSPRATGQAAARR